MDNLYFFPHGFLFVDKKRGDNSTYVVSSVKKYLKTIGIKDIKVGHAGTLDPFAEGVLPIAIGEATKAIDYVMQAKKVYEFTIKFGVSTDTFDNTGEILNTSNVFPTYEEIIAILPLFIGNVEQTPPKFSAIKINGERAYKLARENKEFKISTRKVFIHNLEVINYNSDEKTVSFKAIVGKGTYIRSLGVDIANKLGALGCISYLRRSNYVFNKEILLIPQNITYNLKEQLVSIEDMLDGILAYPLNQGQALLLFNGNLKLNEDFVTNNSNSNIIKATYNEKLVALLKIENTKFSIIRVFNHHKKTILKGEN